VILVLMVGQTCLIWCFSWTNRFWNLTENQLPGAKLFGWIGFFCGFLIVCLEPV